jgi:hypothetical protein
MRSVTAETRKSAVQRSGWRSANCNDGSPPKCRHDCFVHFENVEQRRECVRLLLWCPSSLWRSAQISRPGNGVKQGSPARKTDWVIIGFPEHGVR